MVSTMPKAYGPSSERSRLQNEGHGSPFRWRNACCSRRGQLRDARDNQAGTAVATSRGASQVLGGNRGDEGHVQKTVSAEGS